MIIYSYPNISHTIFVKGSPGRLASQKDIPQMMCAVHLELLFIVTAWYMLLSSFFMVMSLVYPVHDQYHNNVRFVLKKLNKYDKKKNKHNQKLICFGSTAQKDLLLTGNYTSHWETNWMPWDIKKMYGKHGVIAVY